MHASLGGCPVVPFLPFVPPPRCRNCLKKPDMAETVIPVPLRYLFLLFSVILLAFSPGATKLPRSRSPARIEDRRSTSGYLHGGVVMVSVLPIAGKLICPHFPLRPRLYTSARMTPFVLRQNFHYLNGSTLFLLAVRITPAALGYERLPGLVTRTCGTGTGHEIGDFSSRLCSTTRATS